MRASGSKLPLLARCAYTCRPDVTLPAGSDSEPAARGRARHEDFEAWVKGVDGWESPALSAWPDEQAARRRFLLELSTRLPMLSLVETEVVMVYDTVSGRTRRSPHKRTHDDADAVASEIRLIADAASGDLVVDYKTGRPVTGAEEQTRALALAWASLHGLSSVRAALAYIDDAGRVWRWDEQRLDSFDLVDAAGKLLDLYAHETEHVPRPGPWCRELYCPLAGTCPATAPALVVATGGAVVPSLDPQTPAEATALYLARTAVRAWEMNAFTALRRYVDSGLTIAIGDGREWGRVEGRGSERVTLTEDGTAYLHATLPDCLEVSTSKTAINACATKAQAKEVLAKLGELGCLATKSSIKYEEIEK